MSVTPQTLMRSPLSDYLPDHNRQRVLPPTLFHTPKSQLRHESSLKAIHPYIDSSESEFSEYSNVYDAQVYSGTGSGSSNENERTSRNENASIFATEKIPKHESIEGNDELRFEVLREPPLVEIVQPVGEWNNSHAPDNQSRLYHPPPPTIQIISQGSPSNSGLTNPTLETITEQRSFSALRQIHSMPGLQSLSASINPNNGNAGSPRLSSLAARGLGCILTTSPRSSKARRRKSVSLDDLALPSIQKLLLPPCSHSSSSEDEKQDQLRVVYPTVPPYAPPSRTLTPPGLPSFGSREAIRYLPRDTIETPISHDSVAIPSSQPSRGLRGFMHRVFVPYTLVTSPPQSIGLPPGVIARAADGSLVRGRFGMRQSGHMGLSGGSISLERHPWHRDDVPVARTLVNETEGDRGRSVERDSGGEMVSKKKKKKRRGKGKKDKAGRQNQLDDQADPGMLMLAENPVPQVSGALLASSSRRPFDPSEQTDAGSQPLTADQTLYAGRNQDTGYISSVFPGLEFAALRNFLHRATSRPRDSAVEGPIINIRPATPVLHLPNENRKKTIWEKVRVCCCNFDDLRNVSAEHAERRGYRRGGGKSIIRS